MWSHVNVKHIHTHASRPLQAKCNITVPPPVMGIYRINVNVIFQMCAPVLVPAKKDRLFPTGITGERAAAAHLRFITSLAMVPMLPEFCVFRSRHTQISNYLLLQNLYAAHMCSAIEIVNR